ncbi:MAG: metallophosphoesterase [Planctomycetes bacterium]|nr:metallophosphoesterase [Planctomycetota bacterium]
MLDDILFFGSPHGRVIIETNAVQESVQFIHLGDPHLITDDCQTEQLTAWARYRRDEVFVDPDAHFQRVLDMMPLESSDLVVCAGDLIDFYEESQVDYAMEKVKAIPCPFYMTLGNHDYQDVHWQDGKNSSVNPCHIDKDELKKRSDYWSKKIGHDMPHWRFEHKGINFVGIDNASYEFTESALQLLREVAAEDKLYIIFSHIPIALPPLIDRMEFLGGVADYMKTDDPATREFMDIIEGSNNFLGSFAGHSHFKSENKLGDSYQFITADVISNGFREVIIRPIPEK